MYSTRRFAPLPLITALLGLGATGCVEEIGDYELRVYGEPYIEEGIPAETFVDGWSVEFDEFVVVVSDVGVSGDGVSGALEGARVFDLARPSGGDGHLLGTLAVEAGTYDAVRYRIGPADDATALTIADGEPSATEAQVARMTDDNLSIYVAGQASRGGETISFRWGFGTDTTYSDCETGGPLDRDARLKSELTIHADHLFYDDLVSEEPNVAFDLIAAADADMDGEVTQAELGAVDITGETRYQVGNMTDVTDLSSFVVAQTRTVGHIDGEGHCDGS